MPKASDSSNAIERHVGQRIRERRTQLGLTQQQLAKMIGVTYQQAHKYEKGINRISSGRLFGLAQALGVDVGFFFQGLEEIREIVVERQRMSLDLSRNFSRIKHERSRDALAQLCRAMAHWDNPSHTDPAAAERVSQDAADQSGAGSA